jgi:Heavy-metal resistance
MKVLSAAVIVLFAGSALAEHHQRKHGPSAYAGMQSRAVKALSDQQLADLRAGRGMGLALAAELNGYPGPMHVLELADHLGLSGEQRRAVQQLFDAMKAEAIAVGEKLIDGETALDRAFKERSITPERLAELSAAIGKMQGDLRAVHLKYHLTTAEVLSPDQARRYSELRGYQAEAEP